MKSISCFALVLVGLVVSSASGQLEDSSYVAGRSSKLSPLANHLARVRVISVRGASAEKGGVTEISSKEAAQFGQRSSNETSNSHQQSGTKNRPAISVTSSTTTTTSTTTSIPTSTATAIFTSTSSPISSSTSAEPITTTSRKAKVSERQQQGTQEVELLAGAPTSWTSMTAVEAPVAMLVASSSMQDLSSSASSSQLSSSARQDVSSADLLRSSSSGTKSFSINQELVVDAASQVGEQAKKNQLNQQTFFYPQQQRLISKTSKSNWYQPPSTTPRPAPIIQEEEQQVEQYVEQQQQQQEFGSAPQGQAEPFAFDFKTLDNSGNGQYRKEESDSNGVVRGSYGYTDANGIYRHVEYVADHNGFRASIKSNEPGLIGETQPASIQMAGGARASNQNQAQINQRHSSSSAHLLENADWGSEASLSNLSNQASPDSALVQPNFESIHKSGRIRSPRNYRN